MPEKIQLGPVLVKRIEEFRLDLVAYGEDIQNLGNELAELVEHARGLWYERSERWQESDRGTVANDWIDTIEELADRIQSLGGEAVEVASELADIENEPDFGGL